MLKSITEVAPELLSFLEDLHPPLFESRRRHFHEAPWLLLTSGFRCELPWSG